jgi:hypothetical protein
MAVQNNSNCHCNMGRRSVTAGCARCAGINILLAFKVLCVSDCFMGKIQINWLGRKIRIIQWSPIIQKKMCNTQNLYVLYFIILYVIIRKSEILMGAYLDVYEKRYNYISRLLHSSSSASNRSL